MLWQPTRGILQPNQHWRRGQGGATVDLNPLMTSNTAPAGYVVSADQEAFGTAAWMAFDSYAVKSYPDIWHSDTSDMSSAPHWLQIQFPSAVQFSSYKIYPRGSENIHRPTSWKLQGSNDGSSWTDFDTQTGISWVIDVPQTFTVASPSAKIYWRLLISDTDTDGTTSGYANIAAWERFA